MIDFVTLKNFYLKLRLILEKLFTNEFLISNETNLDIYIERQLAKRSPKNNSIEFFCRGVLSVLCTKYANRIRIYSFPPKLKNTISLIKFNWTYIKIKSKKCAMAELENCLKLSEEILTWTFCKILWQQEIDSDQYVKNFRIKRLNSFIELKKYDDAVDTAGRHRPVVGYHAVDDRSRSDHDLSSELSRIIGDQGD